MVNSGRSFRLSNIPASAVFGLVLTGREPWRQESAAVVVRKQSPFLAYLASDRACQLPCALVLLGGRFSQEHADAGEWRSRNYLQSVLRLHEFGFGRDGALFCLCILARGNQPLGKRLRHLRPALSICNLDAVQLAFPTVAGGAQVRNHPLGCVGGQLGCDCGPAPDGSPSRSLSRSLISWHERARFASEAMCH